MIRHRFRSLQAARRNGTLVRATLALLAITAASADAQTGNVTPHVADVLSLHDVLDSALARHPLAEASRARV
ncbi:MAG TPA: hypothetical protein VMZ22_02655, partial [Acidimicrobiales bacterium]|nr:hypothetical protein [Acidimicrobiales bacterium]